MLEGGSLKPGTFSLMFKTTWSPEPGVPKHVSHQAILGRCVFMDGASVPSTGKVLIHCLGLSSAISGGASALRPSSTEDMGHRQIQSFARDRAVEALMWTPSRDTGLPVPTAICCEFPSQ